MPPENIVNPTLFHALHPKGPTYAFLQTFDMTENYSYEYIRDALIRPFPTVPRTNTTVTLMKELSITKLMRPSQLLETLTPAPTHGR